MKDGDREAAPHPPMVRFSEVTKRFGDLLVLDRLCLDVAAGEIVSIVGPSGSGKTTLLRVLMTLERVDDGVIYLEGRPFTHMVEGGRLVPASPRYVRSMRGAVGMVFQSFNLFPHMTAMENCIEAPVHVLGLSKAEAVEEARTLLALVGLSDKMASFPGQLSGGQQQRVAIARALAMRPRVLLFDEVTSALDPETVGEVLGVIRQLAGEHSYTMMMVTHHMSFAREVSDRVCFFCDGRILEQGPPEQIFVDPVHERTRQFLSSILEGH